MSAKYHFFKTPSSSPDKEKEEIFLHPRIVEGKTVKFQEVAKHISDKTTFSTGDVKGVVEALINELVLSLRDGDPFEIEGLGLFTVNLKSKSITDPKSIRAENVFFSRVSFRASKSLNRKLKSMTVERSSTYHPPVQTTFAERSKRILSYLQSHDFIRSSHCMALNNCSRYMAQADLKKLKESARITQLGARTAGMYVLTSKNEKAL